MSIAENGVPGVRLADLSGSPARRRKESIVARSFLGVAVLSIVTSLLIILSLAGGAFDFLTRVDYGTLWSEGWFPRRNLFDIKTLLAGTVVTSAIAMLVATPLGLGGAMYLSEYAKPRLRRVVKPMLEILAGIPSIVLGVFALNWLSPQIVDRFLCGDASFFNLAAAGLGVGVLVTPLVASIAEDAMRSVPLTFREGSYGLGARKRTTTLKVVVPAAVSGIVAALVVGVSRAIGETMVVAIAGGGTGGSLFSLDHCAPGQTMTGAMAALAIGSDQVKASGPAVPSLYFVGMLLFLITLALNIVGNRFVRRVRQRY